MKTCRGCGETKPLSEFYRATKNSARTVSLCKTCYKARTYKWQVENREKRNASTRKRYALKGWSNPEKQREATRQWRKKNPGVSRMSNKRTKLKLKYGLTPERISAIFVEQAGKCAICYKPLDVMAETKKARPHIDHNHETGVARGLLCLTCNTGLGMFGDSVDLLSAAMDYLLRHGSYAGLATDGRRNKDTSTPLTCPDSAGAASKFLVN